MHPAIYDLAQAQITNVHRQAQSDARARAARQAHGARMRHGNHHVPGLRVMARRAFAVLGALSPCTRIAASARAKRSPRSFVDLAWPGTRRISAADTLVARTPQHRRPS